MMAQPCHITDYLYNIQLIDYQLNKAGSKTHPSAAISRLTPKTNFPIFKAGYQTPHFENGSLLTHNDYTQKFPADHAFEQKKTVLDWFGRIWASFCNSVFFSLGPFQKLEITSKGIILFVCGCCVRDGFVDEYFPKRP